MKRVWSVLLALCLVLGITACSGGSESAGGGGERRVAMICDSRKDDGGWGEACYQGMVKAAQERGWSCECTELVPQDGYYEAIRAWCEEGVELLYAPGNQYTSAVLQAAQEYPEVSFALLNGNETVLQESPNRNIHCLLPNTRQIGWIAGALAGLMTRTGTIAFIGGMELETTAEKYEAFVEAAKYVAAQEGRSVEALPCVYAGGYEDREKGVKLATELMEQGADVFFGDASAVDSGAREAIDAANTAKGGVTVYDIAQPADLLGQNPCVIGSQVTDNSALLSAAMEAVENDALGGEVLYGTLQNQTLSAGKLSELVPVEVQKQYKTYLQQMVDGGFMGE